MKRPILATVLSLAMASTCWADGGETRPLEVVFEESSAIVKGRILGSGVGSCGLKEGPQSFYMMRISKVLKGKNLSGDIKLCGATAPFVMTNEYIVSGNLSAGYEFIFDVDGLILLFPPEGYYRLISYDSPIVHSDRGDAYAVAIKEVNFGKRFSKYLGKIDSEPVTSKNSSR